MMNVESQSGFVQSRFLVEGHVADMHFLHDESEKGRAELQGPKETSDKETTFLKEKEKQLRMSMAEIMALQAKVKVPPLVNVTRSETSEGKVTLMCMAFGFYPPNISVTWLQDEEPLSPDSQQSENIQLHGNMTYRTWVARGFPKERNRNTLALWNTTRRTVCTLGCEATSPESQMV